MCGLESVTARTRRGIAIETFKITAGISDVFALTIVKPATHEYETRSREAGNFTHEKPKKDIRKFSFPVIAPIIWDGVDVETRNSTTVNGFKNSYDRLLLSSKLDTERPRYVALNVPSPVHIIHIHII